MIYRTKTDWANIFKEFEESKLSGLQFCKLNGISQSNFYRHKARYKKDKEIFDSGHNEIALKTEVKRKLHKHNKAKIDLVDLTQKVKSEQFSTSPIQPTLKLTTSSGMTLEVFL